MTRANPEIFTRTLIYFPILHSQADMGGFRESIRKATLQRSGERAWKRKVTLIEERWAKIEKAIDGLNLAYEKVRLYQDGLPVCGREEQIVADLAEAGSRNHRLLLRLMKKGARLMGTESAALLLEEYELEKCVLSAGSNLDRAGMPARFQALSSSLLKRRDGFIAGRIQTTLLQGETGILFLGLLHSLQEWLEKDIRVLYPIDQPFVPKEEKSGRRGSGPDR